MRFKGYFVIPAGLIGFLLITCTFTQQIKSGKDAFDAKQFSVAVKLLSEEFDRTNIQNEKASLAYFTGLSYERLNNTASAIIWFENAYKNNYGDEALKKYAFALKRDQQYEKAIEAFQELSAGQGQSLEYRQQVVACQQANQWLQDRDKSAYSIETISFNSPAADYAPYVVGPGTIVFTSDRGTSTGDEPYMWTGRNFSDLFIVNTESNQVRSFDPFINSKENEGTISLNMDNTEMFLTRCFSDMEYDSYCKIMSSKRIGESAWSEPEVLPFVKEGINYGHPVLAARDQVLFYSCNDPEGKGGYDIYFVTREEKGWSDPVILGDRINTMGNEKFPSVHGDTLYFSSDHHVGMGGLDIFKTYRMPNGEWSPPYNLKSPVNSGWDDFGFVVDTFLSLRGDMLEQGYFTSARESGQGDDDIYRYVKRIPPEIEETEVAEQEIPDEDINYQLFLALRVVEPIFRDPDDPNSERTGKNPLRAAKVEITVGQTTRLLRTDNNGYLILELEWGKSYGFKARYPEHLTQSAVFNSAELEKDPRNPVRTENMEIVLDPIFKGKEIVLENIYYDYDQWFIREDAQPTLKELSSILLDNPSIRIQLGSHTDCRGENDYNDDLSQKRAQSAVDFLIQAGVSPARLVAKGYGERELVDTCPCDTCSEEQHQANRRTTFTILE